MKKLKPGKKKVCLELSKEVVKKVNFELVRIYGNTFGHFTQTVEDGLVLWIKQQKDST
ncbi:hypothetical protein ES705_08705 [subsurface metagenome]